MVTLKELNEYFEKESKDYLEEKGYKPLFIIPEGEPTKVYIDPNDDVRDTETENGMRYVFTLHTQSGGEHPEDLMATPYLANLLAQVVVDETKLTPVVITRLKPTTNKTVWKVKKIEEGVSE